MGGRGGGSGESRRAVRRVTEQLLRLALDPPEASARADDDDGAADDGVDVDDGGTRGLGPDALVDVAPERAASALLRALETEKYADVRAAVVAALPRCAIPRVSRWRAWNVSPRVATTSPRPSGRPPVRRPRPSSSSCSRASARLARSPRLDLRSPPSTSPRRASRTPSRAPPPRASSRASSATPSSIRPRRPPRRRRRARPLAPSRAPRRRPPRRRRRRRPRRPRRGGSHTLGTLHHLLGTLPLLALRVTRVRGRVSRLRRRDSRLRRRLTRATLFPRYLRHPHRPRYLRRRRPRRPRGRHRRVPLSRTTRRVPPSMFPPTRPFLEIGRRRRFGRAHSSRTRRARHASNGPRRGPPGGIEMEEETRLRRLCADGRWDVAERLAGRTRRIARSCGDCETTPSSVDA